MSLAINSHVSISLKLARAITRARSVDDIGASALDAVNQGLDLPRAAILLDGPADCTRVQAHRGLSPDFCEAVERVGPWRSAQPEAAVRVVFDAVHEPSLEALRPALEREGITGLAAVPLVSVGEAIGTFLLCFDAPRVLHPDDVQLAELIASQVAFAVERWRTEEELEASSRASQQLAAIVRSSGDAIVSKNLDGVVTSWNRAAERMFGFSEQEAVGQSIALIIPADRLQEEERLLARIRAGEAVEMETVRRAKDGTRLPIAITVSPVRDRHGRIVGASKVARDISLRVRADAERAELHRRLTTLVGASAALLTTPVADSVVATTLETAQQLLVADGYAIWGADGDGTWRALKHHGISSTFANRVIVGRRADGSASMPVLGATHAIADVQADPMLREHRQAYVDEGVRSMLVCPMSVDRSTRAGTLVFYFRESRAFKGFELESGQTLANLAAAAMRTADLHEELRAERNAADEASRVKDEFLATLSHELRTPLNAVLGYAQMLSVGALVAERRDRAVTVLLRNAEALRQIIDDVLDVARITSGKLRLQVEPVDLGQVVADAVASVQPGAAAKEIVLAVHVAPALPPISGDRDRLQQVVWNLLSNALKFTPRHGHVRVAVEHDDRSVRLVVEDDGQGIEPMFLPHIFERFRQADSRFSREHGGLGLGLAIARELVQLHGGTIAARSAGAGSGATFTVLLPDGIARGNPAQVLEGAEG